MITKFKIYKEININEPQIGDYVIIKSVLKMHKEYNNLIGRIYGKTMDGGIFYVKYKMPEGKVFNDGFYKRELEYWSKHKEDLEPILAQQKFNL